MYISDLWFQTTFQGASASVNKGFALEGVEPSDIELGDKVAPPAGGPSDGSMRLNFLTGTIPSERLNGFER